MIVDCHTHVWESSSLGPAQTHAGPQRPGGSAASLSGEAALDASPERHLQATEPVDKTLVFGFKSRHLNAEISSDFVSAYVRRHPDKFIGVAGIDPTNLAEALNEMQRARGELGLAAVTVAPAAQDFHPADSRAMQVFAEAARLKMPVFVHQGVQLGAATKMDFARPVLLDEVAREFPGLKLVIAHLGFPWVDECVCLLGKHANVYADISSLSGRPWHAYQALLSAYQYGVMDKLLFGSGFPQATATAAIEALYRINQLVIGTNLPTIPRPQLASIVERDALGILGLAPASVGATENENTLLDANEP